MNPRPAWPVCAVFAASMLVTCLFWMVLPASYRANENSDYVTFYEPVARNLLAGRGLTFGDGEVPTRVPPAYPLFLAGVLWLSGQLHLPEETLLSLTALLGMALASVLVFSLGRSAWGTPLALISALLWMTYPPTLWLTKQPNSEIPFVVTFYGSVCLLWSSLRRRCDTWPRYFVSGLLIGICMLLRPVAIGLGLVAGAVVWLGGRPTSDGRRWRLVAVLLLGNLFAVVPWLGWVYGKTGHVIALSTGGASSMRDGLTFATSEKSWRLGARVPADVAALSRDIRSRSTNVSSVAEIVAVVADEWRTRPLAVAELYAIKAARSWYATDSNRFEAQMMLMQLPYLALVAWGARAAWRRGGADRGLATAIGLLAAYFWGMTVLALSIVRYMVPVIGLLFVLVPAGLSERSRGRPGGADRAA